MPANDFESSRVASGTLRRGAQKLEETSHNAAEESNALSRDDARDGFAESTTQGQAPADRNKRRVLAASTLVGDRVRNAAGESLGKIEQIMIDIPSGRVAYAVLSFGGFLGIGDKLFAVPWNALQIDKGEHEFILNVDRQELEKAPGFDKDNWPDMAAPDFAAEVHKYYGKTPAWEHDFTDAGDYVNDGRQVNRSTEYEPVSGYHRTGKQ